MLQVPGNVMNPFQAPSSALRDTAARTVHGSGLLLILSLVLTAVFNLGLLVVQAPGAVVMPADPEVPLDWREAAYVVFVLLEVSCRVGSAVLWCVWQTKVSVNVLRQRQCRKLKHVSKWGWLWWFFPLANFFKPRLIILEAFEVSRKAIGDDPDDRSFINQWWGWWLCSLLVGWANARMVSPAGDFDPLFHAFDNVVTIIAALMACRVVWTISKDQRELVRSVGGFGDPIPDPRVL